MVDTKGYASTMALSMLNHLLINRYLKQGDGILATPASRRAERLFGVNGRGRTSLARVGEIARNCPKRLPVTRGTIRARTLA